MNTNRSADGDGDADGDADGKEDGEEKAGADTDKTHSSREASVIGCNTLPCTLSTSSSMDCADHAHTTTYNPL